MAGAAPGNNPQIAVVSGKMRNLLMSQPNKQLATMTKKLMPRNSGHSCRKEVAAQGCRLPHFRRGCRLTSNQAEGLPATGPMLATQRTEPKERLERPSERIRAVWIKTWTAALSGLRKREISTFDDPADPWKDVADGKVVHLGGH